MNSYYRIFIWEKMTMDDREGTDFSKKRKNHETELSWRNKKRRRNQNWSDIKETHHSKTDRKYVPRNKPSIGLRATGNFCEDVSDGDYYNYDGNDDYDDSYAECQGNGEPSEEER